ncbi:MAG: T9SS type A sorting domain-containing protein [Bacteroidetes bacterium]|nr:T9SS type A sorting domain-containing protein [Bacteroidota bacterium]
MQFKNMLLAASMLLCSVASFAQITITQADMPSANLVIKMDVVDYDSVGLINNGNAGANQNWNFKNLPFYNFSDTTYYLAPAQAPQPNPISGADLASTYELSDTADYTYYKLSSSLFSVLGTASSSSKLAYAQALKLYEFPLTYQSNFTQSTTVSGKFENFNLTGTAKTSVKVDGYGNVTTKLGTFPCLRVQRINELNLAVLFLTIVQKDTIYEYVTKNFKTPVFTYTRSYSNFAGDESYDVYANSLGAQTTAVDGVKPEALALLQIFPNPAQGSAQVKFNLPKPGNIALQVFNQQGQMVKNQQLGVAPEGEQNHLLELNQLQAGVYAVVLRSNGKMIGLKQLVVE